MQLGLSKADQAFQAQVDAFIAEHWRGDEARWRSALVAAGWSVPNWPVAAGGPGWSATEKYLWSHSCAARGAPPLVDVGVSVIGPILLARGILPDASGSAPARMLNDISQLREAWCVGWAEPIVGADLAESTTQAWVDEADGVQVSGAKAWVAGGMEARWMLCLARTAPDAAGFAGFAVDLQGSGVRREAMASWDGGDDFADVWLVEAPAVELVRFNDAADALAAIAVAEPIAEAGVALARAQYDVLAEALEALADPELQTQADEVAVELYALEAMELRWVDAVEREQPEPFPPGALRLKGRDVLLRLGELQINCLGYYALPYPDEALLHNEGPIGPVGGTAGMRHTLARHISAQYETALHGSDRLDGLKDEIATQLDLRRANDDGHNNQE